MKFHDAQIDLSPHVALSGEAVRISDKLCNVAQNVDLTSTRYLIVDNDLGQAVGIVATAKIQQVLGSDHERERQRWGSMPIESLMDARLSRSPATDKSETSQPIPTSIDCQAVQRNGDIFAITTDDDVFVSWKTIEKTLHFAMVDPVTALANRSVFNNHLHAECNRATRSNTSVGVILIDIDFFKRVNDDYGHAAGDTILRLVSQSIRGNLRSYDLVARYGGDELAVICSGCRPGEVEIPIKRIQQGVAQLAGNEELPCPPPTLSIGACVVHSPEDMADPAHIIASADECLYHAKQAGRNCSFTTEIGEPTGSSQQKSPDPMVAFEQLQDTTTNPARRRKD